MAIDSFINSIKTSVSSTVEEMQNSIQTPPTQNTSEYGYRDNSLQYPLNDVGDYPMFVTFNTVQLNEAELQERKSQLQRTVLEADGFDSESIDLYLGDNTTSTISKNSKTPKDASVYKLGADQEIRLYLPVAVTFQDGLSYNNVNLGMIGAGFESSIKAEPGGNLPAMTLSGLKTGIDNIIEAIVGNVNTDTASLAAQRVTRNLGFDETSSAISSATGTTINPNSRSLFSHVNIRTFSFSFNMVAKSQQEADQIEKIVKLFRSESYPSLITSSIGSQQIPIGYNFPCRWKIRFWDTLIGEEVLHKIKECYLSSIQVAYNQEGGTFHEDGKPTSVNISLTFTEDRALSRSDIKDKGY
jgi:hypothetical protein